MKLQLANDLRELDRLADEVRAFCSRHQIDEKCCAHLNLALEELFTNIVHYAFDEHGLKKVFLSLEIGSDCVFGELVDSGRPFNPLDSRPPNLESGVVERPVGGLGIHLFRSLMNDFRYERRGDRNRLSFTKRFFEIRKEHEMEVVEVEMRGVTVITVKGRVDSNTSGALEPILVERAKDRQALVVNLEHVQYISSAGLRVLLKAAKAARAAENRLALAALSPQVQEVFEICGFVSIFEIFENADTASSELAWRHAAP